MNHYAVYLKLTQHCKSITLQFFKKNITKRVYMTYQVDLVVKNLPANAGDAGSIPGSGRCPGRGNGTPLEYPRWKNPMDREARWTTVHGVTKSQRQSRLSI